MGVQLFDLVNRETHRAHVVELQTGGISLWEFGASFGSSDYVNFTTPRPVNFSDFNGISMWVKEISIDFYSWTTVLFWGLEIKISGGGLNIPGAGVSKGLAKVHFSDGNPVGAPDLIIKPIDPPISGPGLTPRSTNTAEDEKLLFRMRGDVLFGFDKYSLKPDRDTYDALVAMTHNLSSWTDKYRFLIVGHTDGIGNDSYNVTLSKRRAETVLAWIKQKSGHKPEWFKTEGRGKSEPTASNATEEGRAKNRRVEIWGLVTRLWNHH
jgi:outer membrane protein OmpA-like peptidoglycan-associated protein